MKQKDVMGMIPPQFKGQEIEVDATHDLKTEAEAQRLYAAAKKKLIHVNNCNKIAGTFTEQFLIIDKNGDEVQREVLKGDYLRIDIPGPGT